MPGTVTTQLIRDRGTSVVASDIPVHMTLAEYRKRPQPAHPAAGKPRFRLLRGHR